MDTTQFAGSTILEVGGAAPGLPLLSWFSQPVQEQQQEPRQRGDEQSQYDGIGVPHDVRPQNPTARLTTIPSFALPAMAAGRWRAGVLIPSLSPVLINVTHYQRLRASHSFWLNGGQTRRPEESRRTAPPPETPTAGFFAKGRPRVAEVPTGASRNA